jgi:hypothetical protein
VTLIEMWINCGFHERHGGDLAQSESWVELMFGLKKDGAS